MADVLDYKKEYRDLYAPKAVPSVVDVPEMAFVAVDGRGDPNDGDGEYPRALEILYGIQYTIKMSKKGGSVPPGYFDYVVPPPEGLWTLDEKPFSPVLDKAKFRWVSMIRLPEFVTEDVFEWARGEAARKKGPDTCRARFFRFREGPCVQMLHVGAFDDEPVTIRVMEEYIERNGLANDIGATRHHHEIYLSDPRRTEAGKLKTIIRIPVRRG